MQKAILLMFRVILKWKIIKKFYAADSKASVKIKNKNSIE